MGHGMNVSTSRGNYCVIPIHNGIVSTACQIAAHFHPKDGKIICLNHQYDKPLVTMYNQYTDKLVEETQVWRGLLAKRAHYVDMRDRLAQMDKGETFNLQACPQDLEDLDPSML